MDRNEKFGLIIGIIICAIIGLAFVALLVNFYNQKIKLINAGLNDREITNEYNMSRTVGAKTVKGFSTILSTVLCVAFLGCFSISMYAKATDNQFPIAGLANIRVVNSGSMSEKHEKNTYLIENNLNNQFEKFDLIFTYELPGEFELKKYDIVVYEVNDILVVHRIIEIEEPNEKHPDERYFLLQGDANENHDKFPVKYSQMRAIYTGTKIPYVGIFVLFLQSSLGMIAMVIILLYCIFIPIAEANLDRIARRRLKNIGVIDRYAKRIFYQKEGRRRL